MTTGNMFLNREIGKHFQHEYQGKGWKKRSLLDFLKRFTGSFSPVGKRTITLSLVAVVHNESHEIHFFLPNRNEFKTMILLGNANKQRHKNVLTHYSKFIHYIG